MAPYYIPAVNRELVTTPHPPKVLIVEGHAGIREGLVHLLGRMGFETFAAADAADAVVQLDGLQYLILDLAIPEGEDLLRRIRSRSPNIKVALLTAGGELPDLAAVQRLGSDCVLTKPLHIDTLLNWLDPGAVHNESDAYLAKRQV